MSFHDPFRPKSAQPADAQSSSATYGEPEKPANDTPDGSTKEVLAWVDGDVEKAQLALDKENEHESPRKGLVRELNEILESSK